MGWWWGEGVCGSVTRVHAVWKGKSEDAARQKNNWSIRQDGFCHFENGCQGCSLPPAQSSKWHTRPSRHSSVHPFFFTTAMNIGRDIECKSRVSWFGLFWTAEPHPSPLEGARNCMTRGLHVPGRWTQSETKISFIWMLFPVMGVWLGTEGLIDRRSGLINEGLSQ